MSRSGASGVLKALSCLAAASTPLVAGWSVPSSGSPSVASSLRGTSRSPFAGAQQFAEYVAGEGPAEQDVGTLCATIESWARGLLVTFSVLLTVAAGMPRPAAAEGGGLTNIYFGQGCFWHVQHDFVTQESKILGRKTPAEVTSLVGYAGGTELGKKNEVCYHNMMGAPDYGRMGHTEVVGLAVPEEKVGDFAKYYIDSAMSYRFGRADPQDRGGEYRSAIGLPGGMDGPLFAQVEAANKGRMKFIKGMGADSDTVGSKKVWVYDSNTFPFHQGEIYHQFHDDMMERYSDEYHKMRDQFVSSKKLVSVDCPEFGF